MGYANEFTPKKPVLLVLNKSDLLTVQQRYAWADYFKQRNIDFIFFSAKIEQEKIDILDKIYEEELEQEKLKETDGNYNESDESDDEKEEEEEEDDEDDEEDDEEGEEDDDEEEGKEEEEFIIVNEELKGLIKIYDREGLLSYRTHHASKMIKNSDKKMEIGMIGYPNAH